jgi:hypothetical protein
MGPGGTYRYVALSYCNIRPSSLFGTVGDLALWDITAYAKVEHPLTL